MGRGAVHGVEQPVIGAAGAVEPHGMVEARHHQLRIEQHLAMGNEGGIEQRKIRSISQCALMQAKVIGQLFGGANPD